MSPLTSEARPPVHVVHHACHQLGRVQRGEAGERHTLDVRVELAAEAGDDAFADGGPEIGLAEAARGLDQVRPQEGQRRDAVARAGTSRVPCSDAGTSLTVLSLD